MLASGTLATPPTLELKVLDTVTTQPIGETAAEIVAHDRKTQRIFVVNALAARIDVIDISNPADLEKVGDIDVAPYGKVANGVAVHDGIVAIAVENIDKQQPGQVVFFDAKLNFLSAVTVGALPDMVVFSPNGRHVLVANEGEPNSDYIKDPEGTVSIIDLSKGAKKLTQANVRTVSFAGLQKADLEPSVRIFGPGASVGQDIEPEYITVSSDSRTAWVTCQENNAVAIIDIASGTITKLKGLGFKDHSVVQADASLYDFDPAKMPSIGTTLAGQTITLGGISGLHFEGINPTTGHYKFVANTDRGPNAEPNGVRRPFLLPGFAPEIVRFEFNPQDQELTLTQRIALQSAPGVPLTGLPNTSLGNNGSTPYNDEIPVDLLGNVLPLDPLGADLEGIVTDANGAFWTVDEYRPAIYRFSPTGLLEKRYVPIGTAAAAGKSPGFYGDEVLPAVLAQRRQNRGFEAVALDGGKIYAFVQSPVRNPVTLTNAALNGMRNVRIVEFNPATLTTKQYLYVMDNAASVGPDDTRADKLGDAVSFGNGEFLVVERDDDKIQNDPAETIAKKIYRFNLTGATDVSGMDGLVGTTGKTIDQLDQATLVANGIRPIAKMLHVDLNEAGYNQVEKVEGLTIIDPWTIAVINDNDFGVASITVSPDGTFVRNYVPEPTQLGIIDTRSNGYDASDRDSKINIRQWPVKGVFMPDAIASYKVGKKTFLVTANEGDAREYIKEILVDGKPVLVPVFVEAVRVGSSGVVLDPVVFPDAALLKNNANLGRLNITNTLGKNPTTGRYEELYSFGARSFSIWNEEAELVYDSGDDLERITAAAFPANFNASNSSNEFDNRSDDKGPEPEGVVVGKVAGRNYAFIGLERIGGVVVYDVSNPEVPEFVQYINNRNFSAAIGTPEALDLGPEGLLFIGEDDSPIKKPLLVIANEISGTTTVLEISRKHDKKD